MAGDIERPEEDPMPEMPEDDDSMTEYIEHLMATMPTEKL